MTTFFYEWLHRITSYLIIMTAVLEILPRETYQKYVRFVTRLIFVLLLSQPLLSLFQIKDTFARIYDREVYQQEQREFEQAQQYLEGIISESK